jgi:hypothetical protein
MMEIPEKGELLFPILMTLMNRNAPIRPARVSADEAPGEEAPPPPAEEPVQAAPQPPEPRPMFTLGELAPYLPNPHKRRVYSVFEIRDFIDRMKKRESEYEALSSDPEEKERRSKLMELMLTKSHNPQLQSVKSMMEQMSSMKNALSLLKSCLPHQESPSPKKAEADFDLGERFEVASQPPAGLLSRAQRERLEQLLNE